MPFRVPTLSHRIDELLATTDPVALHESLTSYFYSLEEAILTQHLMQSVPLLDEQSSEALHQELDPDGRCGTLAQAICRPRDAHQLANSVSSFLSHEPRSLAYLAPPLLGGFLSFIASLEGDEPRVQMNTRLLAGIGAVTLGLGLLVHAFGTPNREEPASIALPVVRLSASPLPHRTSAPSRRASINRARPHAFRVKKVKRRLATAPGFHRKHHRKHYATITGPNPKIAKRSRHHIAFKEYKRRGGDTIARRTARKAALAVSESHAAPPKVFHGVFKPFRWVLFKPVHRGPG
ncbi:MAG: hypothetical protein M3Z14_00295 [Candidatus Eremiobacteraeota bacterium]|nr:hypothetical protein [Candidatus Eremiobacteraeota bacterium]